MIVGSEDIPTGENLILSASFEKDGKEPDAATGILSLYHGDTKVGEGRIKTQLGAFAIAGSGLYVGRHPGEADHRRLPGRAAARVHRRHDQPGRDRRQRRAVHRPRARGRPHAHARVTRARRPSRRGPARPGTTPPTRQAIVDFVERVTDGGRRDYVPPAERIAVFDNDGTLWCEKPMPIELGFILHRFAEMAEADPSLRDRQPWKAAREQDYALARRRHHQALPRRRQRREGADGRHPAGVRRDDASTTTRQLRDAFLDEAPHPTLGRRLRDCAYLPMVELLRYLEANGFTNYIASGGDRDFMRPVTDDIYGIPPSGSSAAPPGSALPGGRSRRIARLRGRDGRLRRRPDEAGPDLEPDRPTADPRRRQLERRHPDAAVRRWHRRRPALRLLVLHDDAEREFDYTAGAEKSLEQRRGAGLDRRQHEERLVEGLRRRAVRLSPTPTAAARRTADGSSASSRSGMSPGVAANPSTVAPDERHGSESMEQDGE